MLIKQVQATLHQWAMLALGHSVQYLDHCLHYTNTILYSGASEYYFPCLLLTCLLSTCQRYLLIPILICMSLCPQVSMAFCSSTWSPLQGQQLGLGRLEGWMGMALEDFLFTALSPHEALGHTLKSHTLFNAVSPMLRSPHKSACKTTALTEGLASQVPQESGFHEGSMYFKK